MAWACRASGHNCCGFLDQALEYWLLEAGHDVLLVEQAPRLRQGGYLIDFWGGGYDIADKMGLIPQLRAQGYQMQEVRYVDERGRAQGAFPVEVFDRITQGRFTSLRRSDLAATLYAAVNDRVQSRLGDSIAAVDDRGKRVRIAFDRAAPCDVDLVVGADGLHSRVRRLVFGEEEGIEVSLGYHVAAFEADGYLRRDELVSVSHAVPGRQISRITLRDDKTLFLLVFRDE